MPRSPATVHASTRPAYTQAKPDLVVLIAVDQFSAGLFDQWRGRFKAGLKRLMDEGIVYSSAYQSHGLTETCAGHSTMLTGKHPGRTGIVANEWFDTKVGDQVYCVEAPAFSSASNPAPDYSPRDRYALSVMEGRSGDIIVAFKSGIATGPAVPTGTLMGHSGPYRSDTAVPIVFWWQGIKGQTRILPVDTTLIAPTLANIIM